MLDASHSRSGWTSHEVVVRVGGRESAPVWKALIGSGRIDAQPIVKMKQVEEVGWPDAANVLFLLLGTDGRSELFGKTTSFGS